MHGCSGSDKPIHRRQRPTTRLAPGDHAPPFIRHVCRDRKDPRFETERQLFAKPRIQLAAQAGRKALDPVPQLTESRHAQENPIFVRILQPCDDAGVGLGLRPFGNDIRVEQEAHRPDERNLSFERFTSSPESCKGEFAKNCASVPMRFVLRSHSSAETTTTALRPFRVIVCGPVDRACSITSLNDRSPATAVQITQSLDDAQGLRGIIFGRTGRRNHCSQLPDDDDRHAA